MRRENIKLSVCVPALNEENSLVFSIEDLVSQLNNAIGRLEIIIVNDGSSDKTYSVAENLSKKYSFIKIINHQKSFGIGVCYKEALEIATGNFFTWFPADGEDSAKEIIKYFDYLNNNVVVTGYHLGNDPRSIIRKIISKLYTAIINIIFGLKVIYYNGLAIYPIETLKNISFISTGFAFNAELIIRSIKKGCQIKQVPTVLNVRDNGKSKALTFKSFYAVVRDVLVIFFDIRRSK